MPWCRVSTAPAPQLPWKRGDTLVPPCTRGAHLLKRAGVKKLRKKKEEKGEEESDKDPGSKPTREPRKKRESLPPRSRVAKGPKKQQGGGRHPPLCEHPLMAPHVPLHIPVHPVPPVPSTHQVSSRAWHMPGGLFGQNSVTYLGGKGMW